MKTMPLTIGVPTETVHGERRLCVVPDVVKRYLGLGAQLLIQSGAGQPAHLRDEMFGDVRFAAKSEEVYSTADVVLCVQPPSVELIATMKPGSVLLGMLQPWSDATRAQQLMDKQITSFALELLPRITRSQSMDALSSQAAVAGYECALIAADHCPKFWFFAESGGRAS
jgi:NAD(P) transhydrogenase subunit alpha